MKPDVGPEFGLSILCLPLTVNLWFTHWVFLQLFPLFQKPSIYLITSCAVMSCMHSDMVRGYIDISSSAIPVFLTPFNKHPMSVQSFVCRMSAVWCTVRFFTAKQLLLDTSVSLVKENCDKICSSTVIFPVRKMPSWLWLNLVCSVMLVQNMHMQIRTGFMSGCFALKNIVRPGSLSVSYNRHFF